MQISKLKQNILSYWKLGNNYLEKGGYIPLKNEKFMSQKMKSIISATLLLLCIMFPFTSKGQVTTSAIVGHVVDDENKDVVGA